MAARVAGALCAGVTAKVAWGVAPLVLYDDVMPPWRGDAIRFLAGTNDTGGLAPGHPLIVARRLSQGADRFLRDVVTAGMMLWDYSPCLRGRSDDWEAAHVAASARLVKLCKVGEGGSRCR